MDRIKKLFQNEQAYEPLEASVTSLDRNADDDDHDNVQIAPIRRFSWLEYGVFFLLGIAMLWSWNMFLAASTYFQRRFKSNPSIHENFQAAEISVSTITNLISMLVLTRLQSNANYPKRITVALVINTVVFSLLAVSTAIESSAEAYFAFLIIMIFTASLATGLIQNGIFAYVSGFALPQYTQGIMTGQAVAGVLPCIAQIVSVLSVRQRKGDPKHDDSSVQPSVRSTAAMAYFLTAVAISVFTFFAFAYLSSQHREVKNVTASGGDEPIRKSIPTRVLARKLVWPASAVVVVFAITMVFPVFTQQIVSVMPRDEAPVWLQPASFIPLAFLFWNTGDLAGRLLTAIPALSLISRPRIVFLLAAGRIIWIGLYYLCNIRGRGAAIQSDVFYLVIVQLLFGLTNGYLGSTCMIGAGQWVEPEQREAAGGFMSLCLVIGLTIGSLLSFSVASK